jgi:RNA polymerase sigma-70 factor (ECF subfamily)
MQVVTMGGSTAELADQAMLDLVNASYPRIYQYARYLLPPDDAQDATQAALEHLWRNRGKYRDEGDDVADRWVIRVSMNKIRDEARRLRRQPVQVTADDLEIAVGDGAAARADRAELRAAIDRLPAADADLIALRFAADLPIDEIARLVGRTPGAVTVALHRAIKRLKAEMNTGDHDA